MKTSSLSRCFSRARHATSCERGHKPILAIVTMALSAGCASSPSVREPGSKCLVLTDEPPRASLGAVALVCPPEPGVFWLGQPPLTRSVASAAAANAATRKVEDTPAGDPMDVLARPIAWTVAAAGGIAWGALAGMSAVEAEKIVEGVRRAGEGFRARERLSQAIRARAARLPVASLREFDESVPEGAPNPRPAGTTSRIPPPSSHPLVNHGIDTILFLRVAQGLQGEKGINRPPALYLRAHLRLVRTKDGSRAGDFVVEYVSDSRDLADWTAGDARLLRAEWEIAALAVESHLIDWLARAP